MRRLGIIADIIHFPRRHFEIQNGGSLAEILVGATSGFHQGGLNMHSGEFHALVTKCIVLARFVA